MTKKSDTPAIRFKGVTDTWEQRKLGELGTITTGSTPSTSIPDYYSDDGIVWVTPTDICENITFESARKLSDLGQQVGRVVPKNTILVTCIASIGKNTMLGNTGSFNQQINGLTPNENECDPYFLLTESALWSAKMKSSAAAGTMQIVNRTEFSELKTWLPSLIEQQAISDFFRQLDNLITLHQRKYDKLTNVKKSMLEKMFPKNGSNVPEIRFKGFTEAWEQRKLGDIGKARSGVGFPDAEQGGVTGIPFFKVSDMNLGGNENEMTVANNYVTAEQIAVHRWSPITELPAIFFAKVGAAVMLNRKRLCRFPFLLDNNTMAYSLSSTKWDADFAKALFGTVDLTSLVQVGALPSYNAGDVESMKIYLPSLLEQEQIGGFFKQLDDLITLHQRELEKLKNIKKSCLENMFV